MQLVEQGPILNLSQMFETTLQHSTAIGMGWQFIDVSTEGIYET